MSRHERFGFVRVVAAGLTVWLAFALHVELAALVVVGTGFGCVWAWRWIGATLRRRLEPRSSSSTKVYP